MKNIIVAGVIFLMAALLAAPAAVQAQFSYITNADGITVTITGYAGAGGDVTIPATNNTGLPVTSIGDLAFHGCSSLTSVMIPGSVTSLGKGVFLHCASLTNATIAEGVTSLGQEAFFGCSRLTSVTIPGSVTNIGEYAFADCTNLIAITVDAQNSICSGVNGVLFDKSQTTLVEYPGGLAGAYTIPGGVTTIGDFAFDGCTGLTSVTILGSVTTIGEYAFYNCHSLSNATIANGVASIGDNAFDGCTGLTSVTIPGSVTSLGQFAFCHCDILSNATIANGVPSIGEYAFDGCPGLTSVTIPGSVSYIGDEAFEGCSNLTSATIPGSVTNIEMGAFQGCFGLRSFYFQGNAPTVDGTAFMEFFGYPFLDVYLNATVYYLPGTTGWSSPFAGLPAVLWNPVIQTGDGGFGVRNNEFGFNITGTTNIPIVVEACSNLADPVWTPLQSLTLTNGSYYFSEPLQTNSASRFYRISAQ